MESIIQAIVSYVSTLDWTYILTFLLLAHLINGGKVKTRIRTILKIKMQTRYRVALIGILLGIALYFIRGYRIEQLEILFTSFVFTLVFHKLLLDRVIQYVTANAGAVANRNIDLKDE